MKASLGLAGAVSAAAMLIAGCIAGNRELESLSISPATATANGSAVQFTATGYWSMAPTTVTPQSANWGACTEVNSVPESPTSDVTVSTTGQATCASGATGTFAVFAWDPQYGAPGAVCNELSVTACGPGCGRVAATAQLTCP